MDPKQPTRRSALLHCVRRQAQRLQVPKRKHTVLSGAKLRHRGG
jgi:hypothetical protein